MPPTSAATPTAPTPALKLSSGSLDPALQKQIAGLPRRVNDEFQNQGDMVNFVLVGSEQQVKDALDAANWHVADIDSKEAVLKAVLQTYQKKDYLQMPMSQLHLFGRKQDYGYELAQAYSVVASRHHFRIWKAPTTWKRQTVWAERNNPPAYPFEKDQRNGKVTHKIDPAVDGERDNIGQTLQASGKVKSLFYSLSARPSAGRKKRHRRRISLRRTCSGGAAAVGRKRASGVGPRTSDVGPRTSDIGLRTSDFGPLTSDLDFESGRSEPYRNLRRG